MQKEQPQMLATLRDIWHPNVQFSDPFFSCGRREQALEHVKKMTQHGQVTDISIASLSIKKDVAIAQGRMTFSLYDAPVVFCLAFRTSMRFDDHDKVTHQRDDWYFFNSLLLNLHLLWSRPTGRTPR